MHRPDPCSRDACAALHDRRVRPMPRARVARGDAGVAATGQRRVVAFMLTLGLVASLAFSADEKMPQRSDDFRDEHTEDKLKTDRPDKQVSDLTQSVAPKLA